MLDELPFDEVPVDPPADYYSGIDDTDPHLMREQLHRRIRDHAVFPYLITHEPQPS